jgi:hypothetical protein
MPIITSHAATLDALNQASPDIPVQAQDQTDASSAPDNSAPAAPVVKTVDDFFKVVGEKFDWFKDNAPEPANLALLQSLTNLESFKQTDNSFQLNVAGSTRVIQWVAAPPDKPENQYIQGQSDGFSLSDAKAMAALSAVKGWKQVTVNGSPQEKELMWLAAQMQGLEVPGYEPSQDSAVYQQWQKIKAGAGPEIDAAKGPVIAAAAPEAEKPEPAKDDLSALSVQELKDRHDRLLSAEKSARAQKQAVNKELAQRKGTAVKEFTRVAQTKAPQHKAPIADRHTTSKFVKDEAPSAAHGKHEAAPAGRHEATQTNPAYKIPTGTKTGRNAHAKPS